jgi:hypothetical protein
MGTSLRIEETARRRFRGRQDATWYYNRTFPEMPFIPILPEMPTKED